MSSTTSTAYTFDNSTRDARDQVQHLAGILDPHTFAVLDDLALPARAVCADLGAGAGTVAARLAERTGPDGHVVVIDLQPQHVPTHPRITIRQQDLVTADLEPDSFDLIHARLLLMHLGQREQILHKLAAALKPGGAMVISDWATDHLDDMFVDGPDPIREVFSAFQHTMIAVCEGNGMDSTWARRVPAVMRQAGLTGIRGETYNRLWNAGEPGMALHASNSRQLEPALLDAGMTRDQLALLRDAMTAPKTPSKVMARSWPMHTTVGFRPAA
ncbi:methyltransferase domain-containing protein [Paractinoplanes ferrugineus]|uniref:Methyltransferase n=1 Tax=Paractinoplanes ferrugineus TaxID=113564 RepID=A0A919MFW5_9ACTN|nr:methyltransferase domain-containing protein [Actinoplanes ferrugineus]GIE14208.1 methyltransferase [Actinoplanes ferrugineus]